MGLLVESSSSHILTEQQEHDPPREAVLHASTRRKAVPVPEQAREVNALLTLLLKKETWPVETLRSK